MKIRSTENLFMNDKVQRDVLSSKDVLNSYAMCASPKRSCLLPSDPFAERMSLYTLRGSFTVEASLIVPFFLMVLLAFFSFFSYYASAAQLKILAAAEAKKAAIAAGSQKSENESEIRISKSMKNEGLWIDPFYRKAYIKEEAVSRAWIGFTELESDEIYVYITPEGSVYHLYADCTHLELSIRTAAIARAKSMKNDYGEVYRACILCEKDYGAIVYITSEGNCYHSERTCSGLKRTIRQVPLSQAAGRSRCLRCSEKVE